MIDWIPFFHHELANSLMIRASRIGAGKPNTMRCTLMMTVLRMTRWNWKLPNSTSKFSKLFHGLPRMPRLAWKFLNAMTIP